MRSLEIGGGVVRSLLIQNSGFKDPCPRAVGTLVLRFYRPEVVFVRGWVRKNKPCAPNRLDVLPLLCSVHDVT